MCAKKTISLKKAQKWTKEWRDDESDYNKYNKCNAFLVPIADLQGLLAEIENPAEDHKVRAYLGVEKKKKDEGGYHFTEKLIMVNTTMEIVDGQPVYRDVYNSLVHLDADADAGDGEDSGIWDFTTPCPPKCDDDSDLN